MINRSSYLFKFIVHINNIKWLQSKNGISVVITFYEKWFATDSWQTIFHRTYGCSRLFLNNKFTLGEMKLYPGLLVDQFKRRIANISSTTTFISTKTQVTCFTTEAGAIPLESRLGVRLMAFFPLQRAHSLAISSSHDM